MSEFKSDLENAKMKKTQEINEFERIIRSFILVFLLIFKKISYNASLEEFAKVWVLKMTILKF